MKYQIVVTYSVNALSPSDAVSKVARFNGDLVFNKIQSLSSEPEVMEIDVEVFKENNQCHQS